MKGALLWFSHYHEFVAVGAWLLGIILISITAFVGLRDPEFPLNWWLASVVFFVLGGLILQSPDTWQEILNFFSP